MNRIAAYFNQLSPRSRGIAYVMFSVMVWSGWMIISAQGVRGTLSAYDITALRFGVAGALLLPILFRKGLRLGPLGIFGGVLLALLMGAPYNTIAIFGMKYAPASHAAGIINTTMLTLTTIAGILFLKERTTKLRLTGVCISVIGISCLLHATGDSGEDMHIGHIMFLIGGTMWAGYVICVKYWKADPLHATAAVCCFSGLLYLPIYFAFIPSHIGMHNIDEALFQAVYQGVINSIFALLCYNRGIALLGASTSSAFLPLIPAIATVAAIPLLGEQPTPLDIIGIALAAGGVLLSTGIVGHMWEKSRRTTRS